MVEVSVLQLMDEIELRHGVHEDRWNILRGILEKQAEREAAQQAAQQADSEDGELPCPKCGGEVGHRINCPHGIAFSTPQKGE